MTSSEWFLLKVLFGSAAAISGILAATFGLFSASATKPEVRSFREKMSSLYTSLRSTSWKLLPERTIIYGLNLLQHSIHKAILFIVKTGFVMGFVTGGVWAVGIVISMKSFLDPKIIITVAAISGIPMVSFAILRRLPKFRNSRVVLIFSHIAFVYAGTFMLVLSIFVLSKSFTSFESMSDIALAAFVFPASFVSGFMILFSINNMAVDIWGSQAFNPITNDTLSLILGALPISLFVSLLAMAMGSIADPSAPRPTIVQVLVLNLICDGLTILATVRILKAALRSSRVFAIPFAVLLDLFISAVLASVSLWAGTLGTDYALELVDVIKILFGRDLVSTNWNLGPYFWIMHTTFIPTLVYLSLILLAWLGKLGISVIRLVFGRASHPEINPFSFAAALVTFIGALLLAVSGAAGFFEDAAKEEEEKNSKTEMRAL